MDINRNVIFEAIKGNQKDLIKYLIEEDPIILDYVVLEAAKLKSDDILQMLLENPKANPGIRYNVASYWACAGNSVSTLKILMKDHRVNAWNTDGLLYASYNGYTNIVRQLLTDHRALNDYSYIKIALNIAKENGHTEVCNVLVDFINKNK